MTSIRLDTLFLAIWSLLIAPSFCEAGLLAHACLDHSGVDCAHEENCPDDPCSSAAIRPAASKDTFAASANVVILARTACSWSTFFELRTEADAFRKSPGFLPHTFGSSSPLRL